jgi:hypothetical protein
VCHKCSIYELHTRGQTLLSMQHTFNKVYHYIKRYSKNQSALCKHSFLKAYISLCHAQLRG